jgi:uncharacterized protein (DUF305 family)
MSLAPPLILALAVLAGGPAAAQDHEHMPGMVTPAPGKPAPPRTGKPAPPPLYTADDLAFLQHMIMHHEQAIAMGGLIEGRAEHPELIRFAGLVADAQKAELQHMQGLLELAADRGLAPPVHRMHGDPPMAGMLSEAEMKALAAARGPAFERLWLQGMMFHHEGGLAMARAQELRQALDGRQPDQLAEMVDDILVGQRAEIGIMKGWLDAWGLVQPGDVRAPAVEVQSPPEAATIPVGRATTLFGVAVDDTGLAAVEVAVHDLANDRWLRRDGTWGERQTVAAELIGSGPASAAWRTVFTAPSPGRYAVTAEVADASGKRAATGETWTLEAR